MKIQSISNNNSYQNSVSHKARFTNNANYKRLFGMTNSEHLTSGLIKRFKQAPSQNLEILEISTPKITANNICSNISVFNSHTLKTLDVEVNMAENGSKALPELISEILTSKDFFNYSDGKSAAYESLINY